jgi:hypothetical protein
MSAVRRMEREARVNIDVQGGKFALNDLAHLDEGSEIESGNASNI